MSDFPGVPAGPGRPPADPVRRPQEFEAATEWAITRRRVGPPVLASGCPRPGGRALCRCHSPAREVETPGRSGGRTARTGPGLPCGLGLPGRGDDADRSRATVNGCVCGGTGHGGRGPSPAGRLALVRRCVPSPLTAAENPGRVNVTPGHTVTQGLQPGGPGWWCPPSPRRCWQLGSQGRPLRTPAVVGSVVEGDL